MAQQTAVEWLFMTLALTPMTEWYNVLEKAKAMEKEQVVKAWDLGRRDIDYPADGEQYYNETYNK
jgi:hypothetical protein